MELGLRILVGRTSLTARLYPSTKATEDDIPELPLNHKAYRPTIKEREVIEEMLAGEPAIKGVEKNAEKPAIPISLGKNKRKALKAIAREVIEEDPTVDRRELNRDVDELVTASMRFRHQLRMDGVQGWKMKGMVKNLFHHQVSQEPII